MNKVLKSISFFLLIASVMISFSSCNQQVEGNPDVIVGKWNTTGKRTVLDFYKNGEVYEAKIIQMKRGKDHEGKLVLDRLNPEKNERVKPLLGKIIINNLEFKGENTYKGGVFYSYNDGKEYSIELIVNEAEQLLEVILEREGEEFNRKWRKNINTYK